MAKSGSKKRKAGAANNHGAATAVAPTNKKIKPDSDLAIEAAPSAAEQVGMIGSILYEDEVAITTETLKLLAANPDLLPLKSLKALRVAVHDFMRVSKETSLTGTSLVSRISAALTDQRYQDALVLLAEMRIRQQRPKLGTLQRWVRETDAILTPTMSQEDQNQVWETLDAILRATQPSLIALPSSGDQGVLEEGSRVRFFPPFVIGEKREDGSKLPSHIVEAAASALQVLDVTKPEDRRPPNKYPAIIYHSPPDTFPMASLEKRGDYKSVRKDVTGVPGAFTIDDVFTADECKLLVAAAEHVGLQPDEPIAGSAVNLSSTLAHNLIWLADPSFLDRLYERIVDHLPPTIDGGAVKGINARFRLYRYRPGALYRPHIDGAWPKSALDATTTPPSYVYDSDPTLYSRLTLLMYLNDNFEGGCTTFFLPSAQHGIIEARPVSPRQGAVCVFPHGSAENSLLHEGSGVVNGAKYVIRTEVLYEVQRGQV